MNIRNFQPGDEAVQVEIYNAAAGSLTKFKPATVQEVQRRVRARDFDPGQRFYAEEAGRVVGYCNFSSNGRVSFPWCLPGFEHCAEALFSATVEAMRRRKLVRPFAAYRGDWPNVLEFFRARGFTLAREMINFVIDLVEMPTPSARASSSIAPVTEQDVPAIFALLPEALRAESPEALLTHLFKNPYFTADSVFGIRNRSGEVAAVGVLVNDPTYADPQAVDPAMPCFRLGAFGTEGMQAKRIKGLFSFLARSDANLPSLAMDLMGHAAFRLRESDDVTALAGQVASDVPKLLAFYQRNFKKQGSFPVLEKAIV